MAKRQKIADLILNREKRTSTNVLKSSQNFSSVSQSTIKITLCSVLPDLPQTVCFYSTVVSIIFTDYMSTLLNVSPLQVSVKTLNYIILRLNLKLYIFQETYIFVSLG